MICHNFNFRSSISFAIAAFTIAFAGFAQAGINRAACGRSRSWSIQVPGGVPADAIVLFDGKDMSAWKGADDWPIKDGVVTVKRGPKSNLDMPKPSSPLAIAKSTWNSRAGSRGGSGQGRGNSGV